MSTRGQNNIDKIRNLIEETEEQKKYELEQLNNTITNKLIKGAPLKQINLVNTALKLTNANIQNSLQVAQQTVKEVSKSGFLPMLHGFIISALVVVVSFVVQMFMGQI